LNELKDKITAGIKTAMKSGDDLRLLTLRMLQSVFHNREIEKRTKLSKEKEDLKEDDWQLSDDEVLAAIKSEVKKRSEAIEQYNSGGRKELAEKEEKELKILKEFLPPEMSDEEIEKQVQLVIDKLSEGGEVNQGQVMKEVMGVLKGKADGAKVARVVGRMLEKK
jgi:uncharacterized protein YqeY